MNMTRTLTVLTATGLLTLGAAQAQFVNNAQTIGLYHLNESSGNLAPDDNLNPFRTPHEGTTSGTDGGPAWVPALFDNGLQFTGGSNDFLSVGEASRYVTDLTIQFYINPDVYNGSYAESRLFSQNEGFIARMYLTEDFQGWRLQWNVRGTENDAAYHTIITPDNGTVFNLAPNTWTQVSFTRVYDGVNTTFGIYKEGSLVASSSFAGAPFVDSGSAMNVGFGPAGQGYTLDEIRFLDGTAVPEPGTVALAAIGLGALGLRFATRRRRAAH